MKIKIKIIRDKVYHPNNGRTFEVSDFRVFTDGEMSVDYLVNNHRGAPSEWLAYGFWNKELKAYVSEKLTFKLLLIPEVR